MLFCIINDCQSLFYFLVIYKNIYNHETKIILFDLFELETIQTLREISRRKIL